MKLRNKETRIIHKIVSTEDPEGITLLSFTNGKTYHYKTLNKVMDEWKDYEDDEDDSSKIIEWLNKGITLLSLANGNTDQWKNLYKIKDDCDNDFVEKLNAWNRLKDKGFRFTGWGVGLDDELTIKAKYSELDIYEDMNLLFGGEE